MPTQKTFGIRFIRNLFSLSMKETSLIFWLRKKRVSIALFV